MASRVPMERTKTPGVYKRGNRYCVVYRDLSGRQRKRAARTYGEARELKAQLVADVSRGEHRESSRATFLEYARTWIATYRGRTSRGIRPETIADYRHDLGLDENGEPIEGADGRAIGAVAFFGRLRLAEIEPQHIKRYAATIEARGLAAGSVRNALAPVRALFATAFEEGLIRSNPAANLRLGIGAQRQDGDEEPKTKALTEDELRAVLENVADEWRLFVEFLAHTGLRIGEAVALSWDDVDFGRRRVKVRRRLYRGRLDSPKSRYGRRQVPLSEGLSRALWRRRGTAAGEAPVFPSRVGGMLDASNTLRRVMKPAAEAAGVPWAGWHTLRHTCATLLFKNGLNAKQVQVWLGHHSPAFTLATYVHLLPDDLPDPGFLDELTPAIEAEVGDDQEAAASAAVAAS